MKKNKALYILMSVTVVAIILAVIGKKAGWFGKEMTYKVAVEKGKYRTIIETVSANGKIQPETEVKLAPDVSGEIVELNVKEGDYVHAGDLLVRIKPDVYMSARDRAAAAVHSAKARLTQAETKFILARQNYDRNKKLYEHQTISEADFENAESNYKMAKADVDAARYSLLSAQASLKEAEENLIKTKIYAPMSGTISKLNVEKGERVVGTSMMAGTEMLRIADLSIMEVLVEVNENDIIRVRTGDTAIVEVDAYLGDKFKGTVTEIANSASTTGVSVDQVTSFNVKVRLLRDSYKHLITEAIPNPFRPGMSATVDIQTNRKEHVLSVPIQAVTTRTDTLSSGEDEEVVLTEDGKTKEVVFVVKGDYAIRQEVKTGIQDDNFIEINKGVSDQDDVIVAPYNVIAKKLQDSSRVEVVPKKELFKVGGK
ncbi:MAG TPA: efflux RND transporter periplasmic adaptor subunit [Bacteroidetes bacterium]|nr:efflux RND transporter periplasmic adaptor subunit [Bacteroidota bacterium]